MSGTWTGLTHQPTFAASTMLLLTDGSVMCQQSGGVNWYKLTPDSSGSYLNGTWSTLAPMANTRLYYASAVLKDGRVIVCGGEYSNAGSETNACELYDPIADAWSSVAPPAGWTNVGDAASCLLPDGRLLLGYYNGTKTAIYDPVAGSWSAGPTKSASASEESWTLLPDQTVLTVQCSNRPNAEKYVAAANAWVSAGTLPVDLVEAASIEIGPGVLLPDGRAFYVGATNHTALYTPPPIANQAGTWAAGPDLPSIGGNTLGAKDAPGCLMPNGKVLLAAGPVDGVKGDYLSPTYLFEFDGSTLTQITSPPNNGGPPYTGRMMLLPNGDVLFAAGTNAIYNYSPGGAPDASWRPSIVGTPASVRQGGSYTLQGRQINGLSQAVAYGDDATMATNYPLIRLRNIASGHITYCRTYDHSSMGVATGTAVHTTNFSVPNTAPIGMAELTVIANGIASTGITLNVHHRFKFDKHIYEAWAWLIGSLADGPLWVWGPHGPVPVDPMRDEKLIKQAKQARAEMLEAMKALAQLGKEVVHVREKQAAAVAPAVDEDAA